MEVIDQFQDTKRKARNGDYYWGMGLTAEQVANDFSISRDQDKFAYESHQKAIKAISENKFESSIVPIEISETFINDAGVKSEKYLVQR